MAENIKDKRKQAAEDWQNAFPQLVKYAQNKYYKILGSVLVGIELVKPSSVENYSPHFVIYSLWGNKAGKDLKACLSSPIALKPFYNKKGQEIYIPYNKHEAEFSEALKAVKNQVPFSMEGDVSLKKVLSALDEHSKTPPLSAAPNSYLQASLMKSKFEMTLCSGNEKQTQDVLNQIKKKKWDLEHFALWGIKYENWLKDIESKLSNRDQILSQLNANKQDKKLEKLHRSELN